MEGDVPMAEPSAGGQDEDMVTEQPASSLRVSDSGLELGGGGELPRAGSIVLTSPAAAHESTVLEDVEDWGSSFSDTGSDMEDLPLDPMPIPPVMTGRAPAVRDGHWREYRRELNWRCRWVELRMHELREQERRYAALERKLLAERDAKPVEGEQSQVRETNRTPLLPFGVRLHALLSAARP